jgi:hypothetical protein
MFTRWRRCRFATGPSSCNRRNRSSSSRDKGAFSRAKTERSLALRSHIRFNPASRSRILDSLELDSRILVSQQVRSRILCSRVSRNRDRLSPGLLINRRRTKGFALECGPGQRRSRQLGRRCARMLRATISR